MRFAATFAFALAVLATAPVLAQGTPDSAVAGTKQFEMKVLADGLDSPWEVTWGPDNWLWVTERTGGKITRVNPADGSKQVAIKIDEVSAPGGQDGLLGMALDPGLLQGTGHDYVYASYTYVDKSLGGIPWVKDPASPYHDLWVKIVRLTYDKASGTLSDPVDLISGMPGKNDHNSGRLKFGPEGKLYYTIGDGGKDQLGNWCIPIEAQRLPTADEMAGKNWIAYQGKSLRLNLDGSIPDDNPVLDGVKSHVFTYGHRNMQGIDFGPDGTLYASEQGPKTDDEVNILVPGGNYGWPHVAGFRDDKAYVYARWADSTNPPCDQLTFSDITIPPSVPTEKETSWTEPMQDPIATLFTVPSDWNFQDPACKGIDFICWPTVAASSIQAYFPKAGEGIPGWEHSLLVTTLKRGSIYRVPLSADGKTVAGPIERYFQSENRLRDMALSPDMKTLYIATDVSGLVGTMDGGAGTTLQNPGAILVYTYTGEGNGAAAATTGKPAADKAPATAAAAGEPVTFTAEQAARGKTAYDANCVSCHGPDLVSANYGPPLAGSYFEGKWVGQSAAALYNHVHDRMPPSRAGQLGDQTYADLVAYILQVNSLKAGDKELPADPAALASMVIAK
ncbi:MAG: PQQ-dependent sugar dehydrogenase [Devosia sp.]|uniref:glucose/sorbosone family PQQ-dependent dehydrogenase n=1 Tax=Devosia sp. TaxID=1871048 RepID=UPI001AD56FEB|nr:glucose/sorbosone family PQQ-dependent dehydrogenase [Devosia sp.]MBN9315396.1 PQQ-dependent sugar dehydrogenase [Devosia sp.]